MISNDPKQPTAVTSALVLSTGPQKVSNPEFGYVDNTLVISHSSASFTAGKKDWFTITGQRVSAMLPGIGQATAAMVGKVNVMALGAGVMWIGGSLVYHAAKDGKTHAFDVADYDVHVTVAGPSTGDGSEPSATETPAPAVTETPAAAPASQKKPRGKKTDVPAASAPAADVTAPAAPTAPAAATTPAPRQGRGRTVAEAPAAPAAPALQVVAAPAAGTAPTRAPRQPRPVASIPA
jgi:hypothetical protein